MTEKGRQLLLLLWKNFVLQKRHPISTVFQLFLPALFALILILVRHAVDSTPHDNSTTYSSYIVNSDVCPLVVCYPNNPQCSPTNLSSWYFVETALAYSPENEYTRSIMSRVPEALRASYLTVHPFKSEQDIEDFMRYNSSAKYYLGGVVFTNVNEDGTFPHHITFKIRLRADSAESKASGTTESWHTSELYPDFQVVRPRTDNYLGGDPDYCKRGFLRIQHGVSMAILLEVTNQSLQNVNPPIISMNMMPYPPYLEDDYLIVLQNWLAMLILLSYILPVISLIKGVVLEKEMKLKESMKIMGLSGWLHWCAWFIKSFAFMLFNTIIITFLFCVHATRGLAVINLIDPLVLFVFLLLYVLSAINFSFLVSTLFSKANGAAAFGLLIWFLSMVPYFGIEPRYSTVSWGAKIGSSIFPNSAMSFGTLLIGKFEGTGRGIQWDTVNSPCTPDDELTMAHIYLMLLLDIFLYGILALYFDAVFPGDYGLPKPWYFPFMKQYWPCFRVTYDDAVVGHLPSTKQEMHPELFEEGPPNMNAGIQIRGLTKFYQRKKLAVNKLSLEMYEDQITVLLGHNGAGKTTTMSMLTGLYPPSHGTAYINGLDIRKNMDEIRASVGLCPQHDVLFSELTVEEHLYFFCMLKNFRPSEVKDEIRRTLAAIDLLMKENTLAKNLSGGMKRRLSVGIALIGGSKIVMLDEPTSGMDPAARRFTWDLLQRESRGRTILLTTHFMDEADVLGDRIAIMAHGELQCCGTPLFLKKKYGAGYHMVLVKKPNCDVSTVENAITSFVPSAELENNIGAELSFILPHQESSKFPDLFSYFENNTDKLGISSFGASVTTLEEVFLRVGEESDSSLKSVLKQNYETTRNADNESLIMPDEVCCNGSSVGRGGDEILDVISVKRNKGVVLYVQQFWAMMVKKALHSFRNWLLMIAQFIVPLLFLLVTLAIIKFLPDFRSPPPITLDLAAYKQTNVVFGNGTSDAYSLAEEYAYQFNDSSDVEVIYAENASPPSGGLNEFYDKVAREDVTNFNNRYIIGGSFGEYSVSIKKNKSAIGWFNQATYHSPPISLSAIENSLLRQYTNGKYQVTVINHPLPKSLNAEASTGSINTIIGFEVAFDLVFGLSALTASFVVFLVKERGTNAKHLQFVSGVHTLTFWVSTFIWDFINFLIPCLLLMILFLIFDEDGYNTADTQGIMFIIFLLYGWSMLPLMYLFSFLFKTPSSAFIIVILFNVIVGLATMLTYEILTIPSLNLENVANILDWFFLIFPNYAFGMAFFEMHQNYVALKTCNAVFDIVPNVCSIDPEFSCCLDTCTSCYDYVSNYFAWERPGIGRMAAFMAGFGVLFIVLVFFVETSASQRFKTFSNELIQRITRKNVAPLSGWQDSSDSDNDVNSEKNRILTTPLHELQKTDTLLLNKLLNCATGIYILYVAAQLFNLLCCLFTNPNLPYDRDLTKYYGSFLAVDHLSFGVPRGECFGLLGINGAGKTTTFKMLTGDETISYGDAYLEGFSSRDDIKEVQQLLGYCPQFDALIDQLSGQETLTMFARLKGIPEHHIPSVVKVMSKKLMFDEHINKLVKDYSGGNKRKLSTAVSLIGDPPVIFLDEPTTGMDPLARRLVWDTISRIRDRGRSVILTSHSMEECDVLCTRIAIMVNGKFQCLGSPQHLKNKFGQGYTLIIKLQNVTDGPQFIDRAASRRDAVMKFVETSFPGSVLKDSHLGMVQYHIMNPSLSWSFIFRTLEDAKLRLSIEDYSVGQTTLEQVFLSFTKLQRNSEDA